MQAINQVIKSSYNQRYSTVNNTNTNYSTVMGNNEVVSIFNNSFSDITEPKYYPFYAKKVNTLGLKQFTDLANLARKSSDTPIRLFNYFLKKPRTGAV